MLGLQEAADEAADEVEGLGVGEEPGEEQWEEEMGAERHGVLIVLLHSLRGVQGPS